MHTASLLCAIFPINSACWLALQLDVVDPGTVLMWIFGSILALLWLLFIFSGEWVGTSPVVWNEHIVECMLCGMWKSRKTNSLFVFDQFASSQGQGLMQSNKQHVGSNNANASQAAPATSKLLFAPFRKTPC